MTDRTDRGARERSRRGFSLVEVLVATVIVSVALVPIVAGYHRLFAGLKKTQEATHATFLAQAILENVRYRLYDGDERFFRLDEVRAGKPVPDGDPRVGHLNLSREELDRRICARDYEKFFLNLTEEGEPIVVLRDKAPSRYFVDFVNLKGSRLHGITQETNPTLYQELEHYRASLEVRLSVPESTLDSDGDGHPEIDLVEIVALIRWTGPGGEELSRSFFTVFTRHQYNPWPEGPIRCF
ncbi:MAG: type II secretion system protein [Candidatus Riflebacteria bacterium]|nr:type II secretion system protein [Candidatus Riflebacteria bacterium]